MICVAAVLVVGDRLAAWLRPRRWPLVVARLRAIVVRNPLPVRRPGRARGRRLAPITVAVVPLLALTAVIGPAARATARRPMAPLVVRTDDGAVRGMVSGGAREFLGIPYAAPPVGRLRWRPPQPVARWQGIRDATRAGSSCAQPGGVLLSDPTASDTENCLYLNVYTPVAAGTGQLPVMVWIHGGGFTGGAGSLYDGAVLAAREHVIVVTINYRLGIFGFMALPSLDKEGGPDSSGDYGLMDQQAALRWVQRNAAAFGGSRHDVTIVGQSAGGLSVCDNMASPTAAGLFVHAIAESGCLMPMPSRQATEQRDEALAASLDCTDAATAAECLRAKPAAELVAAEGTSPVPSLGWGPVPGNRILPVLPAVAFTTGHYIHVPLLQGTNADEGRFLVGFEFDAQGKPLTAAQYPAAVQALFGASLTPQILAHYPLSAAYPSPDLALAAVETDGGVSCPALQADDLLPASGVYGYEFADPDPPDPFGATFSFPLGSAHSTEIEYLFQTMPDIGVTPRPDNITPPFTAAQFALSDQIMGYWARFAATGDPNGDGAPLWPAFTPAQHQIQELAPAGTAPQTGFAAEHQCTFWDSTGA
jgi:para-nitrobenzyl esterase